MFWATSLKGGHPVLNFQQHQDGLVRRLFVIGIPSPFINRFVSELVKWENHSGVEWTIKRLKSLKVDLIRRKSGLPPLTWVRKNRHGDISGVIGSIFRWSDKNDDSFAKAIQAFMAYSFYILPSLTDSQKEKFLNGINCSSDDRLDDVFLRSFRETVTKVIGRRSCKSEVRPLVAYEGSPSKRAPTMFHRRSVPQNEEILRDLEFFNHDGSVMLYHKYKEIYSPLLMGLGHRLYLDKISSCLSPYAKSDPVLGGQIHFIQEPGGKLRSVASPFRCHQEALRPLGLEVYNIVSQLPWDCTFDQMKAIPAIQSHLLKGGECYSIDLSSATDVFPLSLQMVVLTAIFGKENPYVNLFAEISSGIWESPIGILQWKRGQPLGLYPSFGTFTLTHGLLLLHLNKGVFDSSFFVLGDDVVILKRDLYDRYISMLDRMQCPWSSEKSISSNKLSEFAGKIITSTRVIPQLKWRKMSNDNFLDICRLLGRQSRTLLNQRQRKVFDQVAHLCEPIGLNFSLPGDNLEKMIQRTLSFYQPEEVVLGSLMGLRRRINLAIHSSLTSDFVLDELNQIVTTFDEKVKSVLCQTIFARWESSILIGLDALDTLPQALGIFPRLPLKVTPPSRRSTLERYEAMTR